jgi:hypothetical protein
VSRIFRSSRCDGLRNSRYRRLGRGRQIACLSSVIGTGVVSAFTQLGTIDQMNLFQKIYRSAVRVVFLFCVTGASAQTLPNGTFAETDWGPMELSCIRADLCFASYENGAAFMYFSSPGQDGQYYGFWAEASSSQPCQFNQRFPNIETNAWGRVNLVFDYDGNYWTGNWGYCDEPLTRTLVGERGGTQQTQSSQAEIKAASAAILLGMPYGGTTAEVHENIVSVSFGPDTVCGGPDNWVVNVNVRATAESDGISGSMLLDDSSATLVCASLPFLN